MLEHEHSKLEIIDRKLDLLIAEFEPTAKRCGQDHELLHGTPDSLGVIHKVNVMWRVHWWILCTLSSLAGVVFTLGVQRLTGIHP